MTRLWAVASREYSSFFRTPLGWVVVALFLCLSGIAFDATLQEGAVATMRGFFANWWGLLLVVAPAISMRLFSEETRTGTIEPLLTSPVGEGTVVAAKYFAAVAFFLTMLVPTALYAVILDVLSRPDFGPILSGYLGLILVGMLYLAVGTLASVMTSSQTLAFLLALFALMLLNYAPSYLAGQVRPEWAGAVQSIAPSLRIKDFASGLIDTANIAYFLAVSLWFLAVATVVLQSRRWR